MITLDILTVGLYESNCYILICHDTGEAVIIDPGAEADRICNIIQKEGALVKYIIMTHGHPDHVAALKTVKQKTKAKALIHTLDQDLLGSSGMMIAQWLGIYYEASEADEYLDDGTVLEIGNEKAYVIHTPGHTPGSICINVENWLFTGDTLFAGSVGRTDLPGGDVRQLLWSIKERLKSIPDDTVIYPGHGRWSTMGEERKHNPFYR